MLLLIQCTANISMTLSSMQITITSNHAVCGSFFMLSLTRSLPIISVNDPSVEILASPTTSNFFAGLQLNLTCLVNVTAVVGAKPNVAVTWMRNGTPLENTSRITVQEVATRTSQSGGLIDRYEGVVVFESLEIDDVGTYSCFANLTLSAGDFVGGASSNKAQQQINIESKI